MWIRKIKMAQQQVATILETSASREQWIQDIAVDFLRLPPLSPSAMNAGWPTQQFLYWYQ